MVASPTHPTAPYFASVLFGLCIGNVLTLPTLIFQREFARSSFGRLSGSTTAVGQVFLCVDPDYSRRRA
jgi:hypothetical protein